MAAAGGQGVAQPNGPEKNLLLGDLGHLFGRLGAVGIPEAALAAHPSSLTDGNPWWLLEALGKEWVSDDFGYGVVLRLESEAHLKAALRDPEVWSERGSPETEALALLVALHYRLNWPYWATRNSRSEFAACRLLFLLRQASRFQRPRLRALCALQVFEPGLVARLLGEGVCAEHDRRLIERYVLSGRIREYLRYLITHGPDVLKGRAEAVLWELDPPGQGGIDLPLPPEPDSETGEPESAT